MSLQTSLGSVMEFARRSEQKTWTCTVLLLHHDNAPTYTSLKTTEFVTNNNMIVVPHPPYLRDDVLKQCPTSKGNRKPYPTALRKMTSTVLLKCGEKLWDPCIHFQGDYFEGNGSQNWVSYASISFFNLVWEFSNRTSYVCDSCWHQVLTILSGRLTNPNWLHGKPSTIKSWWFDWSAFILR
jgi:hypothetical protein